MARAGRGGARGKGLGRRLLLAAGVIAAVVFAIQGGEYSTFDLLSQRSQRADLQADVRELRQTVDSLVRSKKAIETDPVVQERIAREQFGMVRGNRELLYRFVTPADSGR